MRKLSAVAAVATLALALLATSSPARAQGTDKPAPGADKPAPAPTKAAKAEAKGPKPIIVERVVAIVDDVVILESELYQRAAPDIADLEQLKDQREKQKQFKTVLRRALELMIEDELILKAAAEAELTVSEDEVEKAVAQVKRENKLTDAQLGEALAAQGYTIASYRKDVRKQILRLRAVNVLVRPRVSVTDADVKERYERTARKTGAITEIQLAHILVAVDENATAAEKQAARQRASALVERARGGEDFAKLALATSEDTSTKEKGGELGSFKRGELPTEWEEQLFAAEAGEIRGPIEGPRGQEVFKVLAAKKDTVKPFDDVKDKLRNELYADQMEKQTKLWLEEQRRKSHVEVKL